MKQAYLFNNPLMAVVKNGSDRALPPQYPLVSVDADNIMIEVVKRAENSRDVILRMHECFNQRTDTYLAWRLPARETTECDMLKAEGRALDVAKKGARLSFIPLEIKTVKLMLQSPQRVGGSAQIRHGK